MKIVKLAIRNGILAEIEVPEGVKVVLRNYDTEEGEQDENGDFYLEEEFD